MTIKRTAVTLSATGLLAIAAFEGYSPIAYIPVKGDVPTIGFGSTEGVKEGDTITVTEALNRLDRDIKRASGALKCVKVPLSQDEMDAYTSLAYNIGVIAFCSSTLVKKLNAGDYDGACEQIKRWVYFQGKVNNGLVNRRAKEYDTCMRGHDDSN